MDKCIGHVVAYSLRQIQRYKRILGGIKYKTQDRFVKIYNICYKLRISSVVSIVVDVLKVVGYIYMSEKDVGVEVYNSCMGDKLCSSPQIIIIYNTWCVFKVGDVVSTSGVGIYIYIYI